MTNTFSYTGTLIFLHVFDYKHIKNKNIQNYIIQNYIIQNYIIQNYNNLYSRLAKSAYFLPNILSNNMI